MQVNHTKSEQSQINYSEEIKKLQTINNELQQKCMELTNTKVE